MGVVPLSARLLVRHSMRSQIPKTLFHFRPGYGQILVSLKVNESTDDVRFRVLIGSRTPLTRGNMYDFLHPGGQTVTKTEVTVVTSPVLGSFAETTGINELKPPRFQKHNCEVKPKVKVFSL